MSVVTCNLYRISVPKSQMLSVLAELELLDVFEPVTPLFPLQDEESPELLQIFRQNREAIGQAIDAVLPYTEKSSLGSRPEINRVVSEKVYARRAEILQEVDSIAARSAQLLELTQALAAVREQQHSLELVKDVTLPIFTQGSLVNGTIVVAEHGFVPALKRALNEFENVAVTELGQTDDAVLFAGVL